MRIVAVPILDSKDTQWATKRLVELYRNTHARIYLINVQPAFPKHVSQFFDARTLARIHREDGLQFLAPVARALDRVRVPHWDHVLVGGKVKRITEFVASHYCTEVLVRNKSESLLRLFPSSVNSGVLKTLRALYPEGKTSLPSVG
jgi:hypothetical protein